MGAAEVDADPAVRLAALVSTRPAELVAAVRLAAGRDLDAVLDSPTRLRALVVREHLGRRGPMPPPDPMTDHPSELVDVVGRINTLGRLDRTVLVLVDVEHLTRAEVAGLVDRPLGPVNQAYDRARAVVGPDPDGRLAVWSLTAGNNVSPTEIRRAETVLARRGRSRSRRRGLVVAAAGVAAGALVATGAVVRSSTGPQWVRTEGDWVQAFRLPATSDWIVESRTVRSDVELAVLGPAHSGQGRCQVVVDQRESAGGATGERSVRVRGRAGKLTPGDGTAALSWSLAPGAIAAVSCSALPDPTRAVTEVADQLRFVAEPIRLAYRLTSLPDAFHVDQVIVRPPDDQTVVELWPDDAAPTAPPISVRQSTGASTEIGRPGSETVQRTCQRLDAVAVCAGVADPGPVDSATERARTARRLMRIRDGTVLAPSGIDRATWFDARDALPRT